MELKSQDVDDDAPGVRQVMNRHPAVTTGAVLVVVVACLALAFKPAPRPQAYFTIDDGATFFEAPARVPPFTYHGKEAVRAVVFSCDGGKTKFVGYLLRHPPEEIATAEKILAKGGRMPPGEVKRPGEAEWSAPFNPTKLKGNPGKAGFERAHAAARHYDEVINVKCREGNGTPLIINPG